MYCLKHRQKIDDNCKFCSFCGELSEYESTKEIPVGNSNEAAEIILYFAVSAVMENVAKNDKEEISNLNRITSISVSISNLVSEYIPSDSGSTCISDNELDRLSKDAVNLAKNEIYADQERKLMDRSLHA